MAKKATKAQVEQRIRIVYELLLSDMTYSDIIRYCAETWGVKSRQADVYISRATVIIAEEAARMRENALEKHLAQRASLRNKALKEGDKRLAFDILRDETKLLDLYPADRKEISGKDGGPIESSQTIDFSKLTDDEIRAYLSIAAKFSDDSSGDTGG